MGIIQEMREVCQQRKLNAKGKMVWTGYWFNTLLTRHFSIYFTWLFVKIGFSANMVTFLMIPVGLLGAALCVPHILWLNIIGFLLLLFAVVLDCVDGEVARWTKKSSIKGCYLDLVSHILCHSTLYILCPLHLYVWKGEVKYLILAFVCYAASNWSLSLLYAYMIIKAQCRQKGLPNFSPPREKPVQIHGVFKQRAGRIIKSILVSPSDKTMVDSASAVSIIVSYAGVTWPIVFVSWFLAISLPLIVIAKVVNKYFLQLPDKEHVKVV